MQSVSQQSAALHTTIQDKEADYIIISHISLLLTSLNQENFTSIKSEIYYLLDKTSIQTYIKFWKRLLILCTNDIKEKGKFSTEDNLLHRLLKDLFETLIDKDFQFIQILLDQIFNNLEFRQLTSLTLDHLIRIFDKTSLREQKIIELLNPSSTLAELKTQISNIKMNNQKYFQTVLQKATPNSLESTFTALLVSLSGETLNDMVALLLSELLSPGSQNVQADPYRSYFTPAIVAEATTVGTHIANAFKGIPEDSIDWNRVFNLMSTKYFLKTPMKPTLASLSSLFAALHTGKLFDQFFNCDWHIIFKLELAIQLHKWSPQNGCLDLLAIEGTKKVCDSQDSMINNNTLLYLMAVATLDLEIFLLREELTNNPMLQLFQEFFFEDFNSYPVHLVYALINNMKHFTLLIENKNVIDEILVTLMVQIYETTPLAIGNIIDQLPNPDKIVDVGRILILKEKKPMGPLLQILLTKGKLDSFLNKLPFENAIKVLPTANSLGWENCNDFIKQNLDSTNTQIILDSLDTQLKLTESNVPMGSSQIFDMKTMHSLILILNAYPLTEPQLERFEKIQFLLLLAFPRLINFGFGHDDAILANVASPTIPQDIEKEMQNYLQKMYSGELAIKDIIEVLRKLRDSDNPRDQDVFACITHAVIAESNFFKDYPLDALATTSVLFGSMILFQLLRGFVLDVALKIILDFAKEGPDSKMFKFAIQAIYAFRIRLADYPQYCKDLLDQVPGLQTQSQVYQFIQDVAKSSEQQAQKPATQEIAKPKIEMIPLKYFVIDDIQFHVVQESPPKDFVEKVLFVVNNITIDNFDTKINDLKPILTPNYFSWFSTYLVNQRAKTEPNYHTLYSKVLVGINSEALHAYMLNDTLKQLYIILATRDIQLIDKNHLKNLSSWLGHITLAIDRPLKHQNIAIRELLLDAYSEKRLEVVIPFICRMLQLASESKIFRPPNPWTVGILKVLLELNEKANWKLSLTFEVEVLMKSFKLGMKAIDPSNFIGQPNIIDKLSGKSEALSFQQQQLEHQRQAVLMQQHQQQMMLYQQRQQQQQQQQQRLLSTGIADQAAFGLESTVPPNDNPFNNLSGSTIFVTHPDLKRIFQMALAKSVREILLPAVEKSSNIAVLTTSKIIMKDFATEPDEMKLNAAATTMVMQLAQSLARATSIDSLKEGIRTTTQSLAPNLMNSPNAPMDELDTAINENINTAVSLIEKAAMDKAVQDISEQLMQAVAVRRYHKERRADQPFIAPNTNPYALSLPEPLGLKSTGVTTQQFRIYEDFGKFIPTMESVPSMAIYKQQQQQRQQQQQQQQQQALGQQTSDQIGTVATTSPPISHQQVLHNKNITAQPNQAPTQVPGMAIQQSLQVSQPQNLPNGLQAELEQNHRVLVHLMDTLVSQMKENADKQSMEELGEQNQIKTTIYQILTFIARSGQKDQLALKVAQAVVNSLFATSESSLCREILSLLLEKLCSLSLVARKDVVWWLVYALDSRKFDVAVIRSLLDVKLIDVSELDNVLVTAIKNGMENSVSFAMKLIENTVLSDEPLLMRMDFIRTLELLGSLNDDSVKKFLTKNESLKILPVSKDTQTTKTEKYHLVFTEWVKLLQRVDSDDKIIFVFIRQLIEKGVLAQSDSFVEFIKASLELSVLTFKESDPTGEVFTAIDALGKLLMKLFVYQDFNKYSRSEYMNIIFSVFLLVFAKDHENGEGSFNERPYFKLLSNILYEWSILRNHNFIKVSDSQTRKELANYDVDFYNTFASYLHSLQPFAFPGFSFAWISLISHRMFLPIVLRLPQHGGWEKLMLLIIDLFKFLDQYTIKGNISDAISVVYKGTIRIILGISNDVPDFLIENHYELMNNLPATYIQLKNVILSAIPLKMLVPSPYGVELDVDALESCEEPPMVFYDPVADIASLKKPVDNYLRIPSNSLLKTIMNGLLREDYELKSGIGYDTLTVNSKLVRAIVLHVVIEAGLENGRTSSNAVFNTKSSYYQLLFDLVHEGSIELKFQVIQVMIEQLRYPNIHTRWMIFVLKNMFTSEGWSDEKSTVQEIILRSIIERILVNKPHPWGLSVIFTQLLRSDKVKLLELDFIKRVPEIENIIKQLVKHLSTA
ncbi:CCR4-NOT core subunit CDC39 NDAI_0I00270 [Naumovozyma dairenensis CBS 421]|uniref:General negative regulator of transcription subunit 1 n=1 Tax=Naumovozyma dairenensis (strain ATCC 10597 / BCRC 20456 / CBS 421 / NBRC 0211 / NRRL Y-12639) TaxID=1071378 RepID=G0WFN5_NAUDC|nr:hypothetical protein NDAI_0I00270 [Naumovozyma dairenensis CBS 421]CCD26596.1 hypothetical protein NDAI_0I00270 [Naumovozyma dairenensis CBS 421]